MEDGGWRRGEWEMARRQWVRRGGKWAGRCFFAILYPPSSILVFSFGGRARARSGADAERVRVGCGSVEIDPRERNGSTRGARWVHEARSGGGGAGVDPR